MFCEKKKIEKGTMFLQSPFFQRGTLHSEDIPCEPLFLRAPKARSSSKKNSQSTVYAHATE